MADLGIKIRKERKGLGLSLKELAERVRISTMTLQRIETGKTSPSVSVLAEIAYHLRQPIDFFFQEKEPKILVVSKDKQSVFESPGMKLTVVAPLDLTGKNVLVNLGEAKEGSFIDPHVEEGHSLVYVLEGEAVIEHDGVEHHLAEGDVLYYDARYVHSVKTISKRHRFLSIFFKEGDVNRRQGGHG
ncbi:MAG TPA: helix-turn-helix domain-containing protein [Syntrophorhabdaceae bacterium]|nr:helix-turn-helix domain-containing protein [Syntrophorhabdaceae bacterium]HNT68971.1 helix-turn-helix domain-containing protein [Syntrophorhabdaceae bacterium]